MTKFDPKAHQGSGTGGGGGRLDVAGDYILWISKLTRERNPKSKKPYLLARCRVIYPIEHKGRNFYERIYINPESLWKLGQLCKAMGHEDAFALDSDREVQAAICRKPFKAKVEIRSEGDKKYPQIGFIVFEPTDEERVVMDAWVAEKAAEREYDDEDQGGGYDDAPPPGDEYAPPTSRGRSTTGRRREDDDIPF